MVKKILSRVYIGAVLVLLYLPIFYLILYSFTSAKVIGGWNGFSFAPFIDLFTGEDAPAIWTALGNTLAVGVTASVLATLLGTLAAIGIHNSGKRMKKALNNLNQVPVLNAEIVTAVGLLLLFTTIGLGNHKGFITVTLSHIMFTTPYVVLSVLPKLKQLNQSNYEAALDLGATPWQAMLKVVLPEIIPSMISGCLLAFTLSIDDFVITQFTTGTNYQLLSTYIYSTAAGKKGMPIALRALSTLLFLTVLGVLIIINFRSKKAKKEIETQ